MAIFSAIRVGTDLRPTQPDGEDIVRSLSGDAEIMVDVKQRRNVQQHKLAMAMITLVWQNIPENISHLWPTKDHFRKMLLEATGYVDEYRDIAGNVKVVPKSMAFDKMPQEEFNNFFKDAHKIIEERIIPGIGSEDLKNEILDMVS